MLATALLLTLCQVPPDAPSASNLAASTRVRLHLEPADGSVRLVDTRSGAQVCTAPCDLEVEREGNYRLEGPAGPTGSFDLKDFTDGVTARYQPGNPGLRTFGIIAAIAGGVVTAAGLVVTAIWLVSLGFGSGLAYLGIPALICDVVGVGLLIAGIASASQAPPTSYALEHPGSTSWY
jgi:hypothetical protein